MLIKDNILQYLKSEYCFCLLFALGVFVKCVLFNWLAFGQIILASFWNAPTIFWGFYFPKMAIAIGTAAFVLLCQRKWVANILSTFIDLWIIANLMYVRSYGMVIDAFSITMIGNLRGFESSLLLYIQWSDIIFPILTIASAFIPCEFTKRKCQYLYPTVWMFCAIIFGYVGQYCYLRAHCDPQELKYHFCWQIFSRNTRDTIYGVELTYPIQQTSILHTIGYDISDLIQYMYEKQHPYQLSREDIQVIKQFENFKAKSIKKSLLGPFVIVIVESFEDWVFTPDIMPNLSSFCNTHHVLYANHVQSQVRGGMSADGQMLINTGLLPTIEGAACYRFPCNEYPGIMHHLDGKSATLVPHNVDVWNQSFMSQAYGYDTTAQVSAVDTILFREVLQYLHNGYTNVQTLTMSTHSPFTSGAVLSAYEVDEDMPELRKNYIKAFNTLDNGLRILLEAMDTDSALQNATLVITGDHIIWPEPTYCPLIIYSPKFTSSIAYSDPCYQMDIYPTLVDVLGLQPKWHGFGVSLLKNNDRTISSEDALRVSDKIHRANYFAQTEE